MRLDHSLKKTLLTFTYRLVQKSDTPVLILR